MKRYYHLLAQCLAASGALIWAWSTGLPAFHRDDLVIIDSALAQDVGDTANQPKNGTSDSSIDHLISNIIGNNAAPPTQANKQNGDGNVDEIISRLLGENAEHQEAEKMTSEQAVAPEKTYGRDETIDRVISSATERQKAYIDSQKRKKLRSATPDKKRKALAATPKAMKRPAAHEDHEANSPPPPPAPAQIKPQPPLAKPPVPKPAPSELAQAKPEPTKSTQPQSEETKVRERAGDSGNAFEQENRGKNEDQSVGSKPAGFDIASGAGSSSETANAFGEAAKLGASRSAEAAGEPRAAGDAGEGQLAHYVPEWLRGMPGSYAFVSLFGICVIIALLAGAIHSRREELD